MERITCFIITLIFFFPSEQAANCQSPTENNPTCVYSAREPDCRRNWADKGDECNLIQCTLWALHILTEVVLIGDISSPQLEAGSDLLEALLSNQKYIGVGLFVTKSGQVSECSVLYLLEAEKPAMKVGFFLTVWIFTIMIWLEVDKINIRQTTPFPVLAIHKQLKTKKNWSSEAGRNP